MIRKLHTWTDVGVSLQEIYITQQLVLDKLRSFGMFVDLDLLGTISLWILQGNNPFSAGSQITYS